MQEKSKHFYIKKRQTLGGTVLTRMVTSNHPDGYGKLESNAA